eukprot:229778_1
MSSARYKHLFKAIKDIKHQYIHKTPNVSKVLGYFCVIFIIIAIIYITYTHMISVGYLSSVFNLNKKYKESIKKTNVTIKKNDNNISILDDINIQNISQINVINFVKHWGDQIERIEKIEKINKWKNISDKPNLKISKHLLNDINISNIIWDFGACGCTGWGIETVNIIKPLYERVCKNIKLITDYNCWCRGFSEKTINLMNKLQSSTDYLEWDNSKNIEIFISHKPPSRYPIFPYYGIISILNRPKIIIGRSMTEVDYIPEEDINRMKSSLWIDELWVPSRFVKIIYVQNGIHPNKIRVIPEAININIYNKNVKPYKILPSKNKKLGLIKINYKTFKFLSVFKWEPRKGYNSLLKAFLTEFKRSDNVQLYLQTYAYEQNNILSRDYNYLKQKFNETIENIINDDLKLNNKKNYIMKYMYPKIEIMTKQRTMKALASLYKTVNCLVHPSHGEGFGLPVLEAMAVGTPVIVTKWSGLRDIVINNTYGYLIDIDGKEMAKNTAGRYDFIEDKQQWAKINITSLMLNMRNVYKYRKKAKRIGLNGQEYVFQHFHPNVIADKIKTRIKELLYLKKNNQSFF